MKYVLAVILVIIMITILACIKKDSGARTTGPLDREEIITAAKEYFLAQAPSLSETAKITYDEGNAIWMEHGDAFIDSYPGEAHKVKLLEGHDYQLVGFYSQEGVWWHDLPAVLVFVDRHSGDVITSLWGKYSSKESGKYGDK